MSGGGTAIRTLYDLLIFFGIALFSAVISKPLRAPPLLFYLVFGALVGNLHWVGRTDGIEFFAEFAITIVFFALGFEETVEHFLHGVKKAWGIASIGAFVPFGCGWIVGVIFWNDKGWWVHLTIATAVTATAVSLTMIVLKSVGLLRSKASMGIMTSAVLDDVGCLVLVAILIPIIVAAAPIPPDTSVAHHVPSECSLIVDPTAANITGTATFDGASFASMFSNSTAVDALSVAIAFDLEDSTNAPPNVVTMNWLNLTSTNQAIAKFTIQSSVFIHLTPNSVRNGIESFLSTHIPHVTQAYRDANPTATDSPKLNSYFVEDVHLITLKQTTFADILWIIGKVAIFFVIVAFLHNVVLPDNVTTGPISYIPLVRSFGIRHLLSSCGGQQVPLIIVTFGLGIGMVGAALGFHPAVGAYFAGLVLEESYFDLILPEPDEEEKKALLSGEEGQRGEGGGAGRTNDAEVSVIATSVGPSGKATNISAAATNRSRRSGVAKSATGESRNPSTIPDPATTTSVRNSVRNTPGGATPNNGDDPCFTRSQLGAKMEDLEADRDSNGDVIEEVFTHPNTMENAKESVGSAAFLWLGPVFFVNLGAKLEIDVALMEVGIPQALALFAILWVGQFVSAALSARFVPGGFSWAESALVGFGMLGRAELYFVVLDIAKSEGIIGNDIFFPMALAAMFMNCSLPLAVSLFRPVMIKYHPEDVDPVDSDSAEVRATLLKAQEDAAKKRKLEALDDARNAKPEYDADGNELPLRPVRSDSQRSNVFIFGAKGPTPREDAGSHLSSRPHSTLAGRRGIGLGGVEMDLQSGVIVGRSSSTIGRIRPTTAYISPSNRSAVGGGGGSQVSGVRSTRRRRRSQQVDVWDEPERPAGMQNNEAEGDDNPYLADGDAATEENGNEPIA